VTPKQVVEALLFVGGQPLTGKRLADLLGGEFTHDHVDQLIDELNGMYEQEGRPYEVRLGEGGYRLGLRPEFERVRDRVYGYGPKEVKLSQDALEVLALVAYQQPVTREAVEQTGKTNAPAVLRQLLRRELIALHRGDGDVTYHTTPRFLQLFGLGSLDDLPLPEDLMFK
jgi:segregation and condensation protein B